MGLNVNDQVLMGMGIESVRVEDGTFEIITPGTKAVLQSDGVLSVRQRIGAQRELLTCRLPEHLSPWRLALWTPFRCVLAGNGLTLTVQGDSVLIFAPQQHLRLAFEGHFQPQYAQEVKGNRLLLDETGGCGLFGIPPRPTQLEGEDTPSWRLHAHLARWDELWVGICPPRPPNRQRLYDSVSHDSLPEEPYPSDAFIRSAAEHCQILTLHSYWAAELPDGAENPPGANYPLPNSWASCTQVPADPEEFARVRDEAHRLGMKFIPYVSPYYSNAPDLFAEMERVLEEYAVDGLYFDGWCGYRDDFRVGYQMMRRARAILGDRILYLHSSTEPFGTCSVYLPFVFAYADFVLGGESTRFGLPIEEFARYVISGHQISNSVGMWCYYGSWSDEPGYHDILPKSEHIEMALRNHVRFWRFSQGWSGKYPEDLARFDREYYGALAKLKGTDSELTQKA